MQLLYHRNTGHDFAGRSIGAGALSIWTHNLKSFEYLLQYTQGNYSGKAVHFASGLEAWELFNHMFQNNITVVAPGGRTVGANGGWFAGGGHGNLASYYGLASDQALEIHVVTADGQFLVVNPEKHEDLFYALRGGGGSTKQSPLLAPTLSSSLVQHENGVVSISSNYDYRHVRCCDVGYRKSLSTYLLGKVDLKYRLQPTARHE